MFVTSFVQTKVGSTTFLRSVLGSFFRTWINITWITSSTQSVPVTFFPTSLILQEPVTVLTPVHEAFLSIFTSTSKETVFIIAFLLTYTFVFPFRFLKSMGFPFNTWKVFTTISRIPITTRFYEIVIQTKEPVPTFRIQFLFNTFIGTILNSVSVSPVIPWEGAIDRFPLSFPITIPKFIRLEMSSTGRTAFTASMSSKLKIFRTSSPSFIFLFLKTLASHILFRKP